MRVLITMHSLTMVGHDRAKELREFASYIGLSEEKLLSILRELIRDGYVAVKEGKYYLTELGVIKVLSIFS